MRLVGGLSNYAQVYKATAADTAEAARDARKAALESLIDSMTDRRGRDGDVVVSLGAATGVSGYLSSNDTKWLQLSLPLGLAVQKLPTKVDPVGVLGQLSFLDLGLYLPAKETLEPPSPLQALHVGAQIAVTFGTPSDTFAVGASLRFVPSMKEGTTTVASFQGGFFAAYYVSFLDFN
jgi:hypothetical protein